MTQTKKLTRLISAAEKYAERAKDVREVTRQQPAGLYVTWPQEYVAKAAIASNAKESAVRELLAVAKLFAPKPKRKENSVLKAS